MASKKENRFAGFEGLKETTTESSPTPTPKKGTGKSKDPEYKKVTVYLKKEVHQQLRASTLMGEEDMSDLLNRLAEEHFKRLDD